MFDFQVPDPFHGFQLGGPLGKSFLVIGLARYDQLVGPRANGFVRLDGPGKGLIGQVFQ